jgi:hypothetical protein
MLDSIDNGINLPSVPAAEPTLLPPAELLQYRQATR